MRLRHVVVCLCLCLVGSYCLAAKKEKPAKLKAGPPKSFHETATPADRIKTLKDFKVELLYSVPRDEQGSWVNLCADPRGRLIVSDQSGGLYRVTVPAVGTKGECKVERIPADIGQAQGLLWANDALYVVVNGEDKSYKSGLYRVTSKNHDDKLDTVEHLHDLEAKGEHGPHAVILAPDGKSLYVLCGNATRPVKTDESRVPRVWDEDRLFPRIYGVGFMKGTPPPAGSFYKTDFDGKHWELVSSGFRNMFDAAFNADGELFTYDSDMEWDFGAPWYKPTRVCHVVSGSDWGWRNGSATWLPYLADTLPPAIDVGPGSPTGMTFGYGAKFPAKYQKALFMCDWSYGKMYAVDLTPRGASFTGTLEEFITATPLALTDVIINQHDHAMYFAIGGRGTQSGLYRVTYTGKESTAPVNAKTPLTKDQALRHELESLHVGKHDNAIERAWPYLSHPDRFIRAAARTAIEHQPVKSWQERALDESNPQAAITGLLALSRMYPRDYHPKGAELDTPPPTYPAADSTRKPLEPKVLHALNRIDLKKLTDEQTLELLRAYNLALYRLGPPNEADRETLIKRLDSIYPAPTREQNVMLTELLCYLQAPSAAEKGIKLLEESPTQEGQIDIVHSLRFLDAGWTPESRRKLFEWFHRASGYKGANNFAGFVAELKEEALKHLPEQDKAALNEIIEAPAPKQVTPLSAAPRPLVKKWTLDELRPLVQSNLKGRDFDRGRAMFGAANCFGCHKFVNEGGSVGPVLTALAGRFQPADILESIIDPDKVISDQYAAVNVVTNDGKVITGRVVNQGGGKIMINTNMLDPNAITGVKREDIEEMKTSPISMMPKGLLDTLHEDEILDLMAFLLSRGDRNDPMFKH
jgi:putative heme-binding domain-containing protein